MQRESLVCFAGCVGFASVTLLSGPGLDWVKIRSGSVQSSPLHGANHHLVSRETGSFFTDISSYPNIFLTSLGHADNLNPKTIHNSNPLTQCCNQNPGAVRSLPSQSPAAYPVYPPVFPGWPAWLFP